jgi:hypothetical protein
MLHHDLGDIQLALADSNHMIEGSPVEIGFTWLPDDCGFGSHVTL